MNPYRAAFVFAGAALSLGLAALGVRYNGPHFIAELQSRAVAARDAAGGNGVEVAFADTFGWQTRHPVLRGGEALPADVRARTAAAIAAIPGVGGVTWREPAGLAATAGLGNTIVVCQKEVENILRARTIRFSEASARVDPASERLLDEVADALRPCVGSVIAVTGHTDGNGHEPANITLSRARAEVVRWELIGRGIPADGLRALGVGSSKPIKGLDPKDPANRRIEFSVIAAAPLKPTPIDTPGPV